MREPFWQRTLELIKVHKISQVNFAAYIGINYDTFRGWIRHNRIPIATNACNIADALGVTVEYLVKGKDGAALALRMKQVEQRKAAAIKLKKHLLNLVKTSEHLT